MQSYMIEMLMSRCDGHITFEIFAMIVCYEFYALQNDVFSKHFQELSQEIERRRYGVKA